MGDTAVVVGVVGVAVDRKEAAVNGVGCDGSNVVRTQHDIGVELRVTVHLELEARHLPEGFAQQLEHPALINVRLYRITAFPLLWNHVD